MKTKQRANEIDAHVGESLRRIRKLKGYTQAELGERVDLTFQQIQKYERGVNRVAAGTLFKIAGVLDASVIDFFPDREGSFYWIDEMEQGKSDSKKINAIRKILEN